MTLLYNKKKMMLAFLKDKPTVFKIQQQTLPPVTFDQLVKEVSDSCGVKSTMTKAVTEALIDRMTHYMELGHGVKLGEFGSFKPVFTAKTQEAENDLGADNVRMKKIRFYPGKRFKQMLSSLSVRNANLIVDDEEELPDGGTGTDGGEDENPYG